MTPLTGGLGQAGLAVLERYADPRLLLAAGDGELTRLITTASGHQQGSQRAGRWRAAAAAAAGLYGDHPAVPYDELAAEVAAEIRLLRHPGRTGEPRCGPRTALMTRADRDGITPIPGCGYPAVDRPAVPEDGRRPGGGRSNHASGRASEADAGPIAIVITPFHVQPDTASARLPETPPGSMAHGKIAITLHGAGQQPPLPDSDMGCGGQLMAVLVLACAEAADAAAVLTPPAARAPSPP